MPMPSIAVLCSKPSTVKTLHGAIAHQFDGHDHVLNFPIILLNGYYRPTLPRGRRWEDYPLIQPMDDIGAYDARSTSDAPTVPVMYQAAPRGILKRLDSQDAYERALRSATVLVSIVDPSPTETWAVELMRWKFRTPSQPFIPVRLDHYGEAYIQRQLQDAAGASRGWREQVLPDWYRELAEQGQVKAYVDQQFAINSLAILGRTFAQPGQPTPWVSKYQLQVLYALAMEPAKSISKWLHVLQSGWTGTGKYPIADDRHDGMDPSLGSPASRMALFNQLMDHGWITMGVANKPVELTLDGRAALAKLHPGCWDPDLPFRIAQWCEDGIPASQKKIDRYMRTFFVRQKRFLDAAGPAVLRSAKLKA